MNLHDKYLKEVVPQLQEDLGTKNVNAVPKVVKVTINVGMGTYLKGNKDFSLITQGVELISGQKSVVTKAKKAISNFKLREGMPVGVMVTLRGKRMYDFLYRLVNVVLPRVRDFRGISGKSFDNAGNYSLGIKEHSVFPEITLDDVSKVFCFQININTTARNADEGRKLLTYLGFPFVKNN